MEESPLKQKKIATLIGRLVSPIVVPNPHYWKHGCLVKVVGDPKTDSKPPLTSVGKLVHGATAYPTILTGFRGFVKVSCVGYSQDLLRKKLEVFLQQEFLGTKTSEGYGRVLWESCDIVNFFKHLPATNNSLNDHCPQCKSPTVIYDSIMKLKRCTTCNQSWQYKKFKIRAGLRADYPKELQRLLLILMLHDFVHTDKHQSKIYHEVAINNPEIQNTCICHHSSISADNPYRVLLQYYDSVASFITRKKPFKAPYPSRYDNTNGTIDFKQLKEAIEARQTNHVKLYNYIYHSVDLNRIVESLDYSQNSLSNHLLLMVNLALNNYYDGKIEIKSGIISLSASERDTLNTAMDAEMHSFTDHDTANSKRTTTSLKRRLET